MDSAEAMLSHLVKWFDCYSRKQNCAIRLQYFTDTVASKEISGEDDVN